MVGETLDVQVTWDDESSSWYATSDDVPGLATGADTIEELIERLRTIIPELMELNGVANPSRTLVIHAERTEELVAV